MRRAARTRIRRCSGWRMRRSRLMSSWSGCWMRSRVLDRRRTGCGHWLGSWSNGRPSFSYYMMAKGVEATMKARIDELEGILEDPEVALLKARRAYEDRGYRVQWID